MGEEQRPWWTQPPPASPPPVRPSAGNTDPAAGSAGGRGDGAEGGEPRGARIRARMRQLRDQAAGEAVPGPRSTAGPEQGAWSALPQFEPPRPPGAPGGRQPATTTSAFMSPPPAPPGVRPGPPGPPTDEGLVVDLRDLDDPHDPLSGSWAGYADAPQTGDATERLPRVAEVGPAGHDAPGGYRTPSRVAPGIPGLSGDADPVGHLRAPGGRRLPAAVTDALSRLPGRERLAGVGGDSRTMVIAGGVVAVLVVVLLVRAVTGGGGDDTPPPAAQAAGGQATVASGTPEDFGKVGAGAAQKDLKRAGQATGEVVGAWGWSDKNGRNLLATTRERRGGNATLRVVHVAGLDDDAETLRVMTDPDLPGCRGGSGTAGFTKNSVKVRDLDKDDVAEVMVGWFARCGGEGAESTVKLALLSDGDKYILRGQGVVGSGGSQAPDPAAKDWPKAYLKAANAQFKDLYF